MNPGQDVLVDLGLVLQAGHVPDQVPVLGILHGLTRSQGDQRGEAFHFQHVLVGEGFVEVEVAVAVPESGSGTIADRFASALDIAFPGGGRCALIELKEWPTELEQ